MGDTIEILATAVAHAGTGALIGGAVDRIFPMLEDDIVPAGTERKNSLTLFAEVLLQFSLGYVGMAEAMRLLVPSQAGYQSPIGDGTSVFFYFYMQPRFWSKVNKLRRIVVGDVDEAITDARGGRRKPLPVSNAPPGTIGGSNSTGASSPPQPFGRTDNGM